MKRNDHICKFLAWTLCLVMLVSMLAVPVLAVEEDAPPAAPAEAAPAEKVEAPKAEAPAEKAETPAEKVETPAEKAETPAEKVETPAEKAETPAEKVETPVEKEETSAEKEETPAEAPTKATEAPAKATEAPAKTTEAPAKATEAPAKATEAPAKATEAPAKATEAPAKATEAPAEEEKTPGETVAAPAAEPAKAPMQASASLFSVRTPYDVDWDELDLTWYDQSGASWTAVRDEEQGGIYFFVDFHNDNGGTLQIPISGLSEGDRQHLTVQYYKNNQPPTPKNSWYQDIPGGYANVSSTTGQYVELFVPDTYFSADHFVLGDELDSALIPNLDGVIPEESELPEESDLPEDPDSSTAPMSDEEAVYTGIVIDGDFSDWAAVPKTEADNAPPAYNPYHTDVDMAVVWDGDYVYIYFDYLDGNAGALSAYGPLGSGQFSIVTDLGRTMLIRPNIKQYSSTAVVDGVDGATIAVDSYDWSPVDGHKVEIAIPTSALPEYRESFSFGYYMEEPLITDIVNMQDTPGGVGPFQANVVIDGKYNDWEGYPHSLIEYDDPGIQHSKVDGEGALWSDDGWLYGHVVTEHPDHLAEQGSCFLAAIEIAFNGDRAYKDLPEKGNFYPRILAINEAGTIIDYYKTLNEGHSTPNGTYTYYIFDTRTDPLWQFGHTDENGVWHDATAADLIENAFGTMKVTVTGTRDEAEFKLDLEKVADYIGQDANTAFKTIDIHWGRIGPQWITTAGTPTGPILGVALAVGAIGAPVCYGEIKKRRGAKKAQSGDEAK